MNLKKHPFFSKINFEKIKKIIPPFIPDVNNNNLGKYFDVFDEVEPFYPDENSESNIIEKDKLNNKKEYDQLFVGFTYKPEVSKTNIVTALEVLEVLNKANMNTESINEGDKEKRKTNNNLREANIRKSIFTDDILQSNNNNNNEIVDDSDKNEIKTNNIDNVIENNTKSKDLNNEIPKKGEKEVSKKINHNIVYTREININEFNRINLDKKDSFDINNISCKNSKLNKLSKSLEKYNLKADNTLKASIVSSSNTDINNGILTKPNKLKESFNYIQTNSSEINPKQSFILPLSPSFILKETEKNKTNLSNKSNFPLLKPISNNEIKLVSF